MKDHYIQAAENNLPKLIETTVKCDLDSVFVCQGDVAVLDLKNYYVGYFSFNMGFRDRINDAPVRIKLRFCETEEELRSDFSTYKGHLAASWLQEEIINLDYVGEYKLPRRYAAKYIEITVLSTRQGVLLSDFSFRAVSAADDSKLKKLEIADEELRRIDEVAKNTLKSCMHRVFEDGPKRDRRLWISDLRLGALSNYKTYGQNDLVRRCLYLFAAADCDEAGFLPSYVYEYPRYISGYWHIRDFALLFVVALCDYYQNTKDKKTFLDIYPIAKGQIEAARGLRDENGVIVAEKEKDVLIDWCEGLKKTTALNGVYLYALRNLEKTLKEIAHEDEKIIASYLREGILAARSGLYNEKTKDFTNSYDDYQTSVHSVVFMILCGVVEGEDAFQTLKKAQDSKESLKPNTPAMYHYLVEALVLLGKREEAVSEIKEFWGGMVKDGADTFYEVYSKEDPSLSPYGDKLINSNCHVWGSTPAYFLRLFYDN